MTFWKVNIMYGMNDEDNYKILLGCIEGWPFLTFFFFTGRFKCWDGLFKRKRWRASMASAVILIDTDTKNKHEQRFFLRVFALYKSLFKI